MPKLTPLKANEVIRKLSRLLKKSIIHQRCYFAKAEINYFLVFLIPTFANKTLRRVFQQPVRALGYDGPIPGGRHMHMVNYARKQVIPIPTHHNKDVGIGLLRKIIREAGVTVDEWQEL